MDTTLATPRRHQVTRRSTWPEGRYVGRPGKFGNPYKVGTHGTAEECVRLYREKLTGQGLSWRHGTERVTPGTVRAELAGLDLLCWCPLDRPCHADVLLQIANEA